VRSASTACSAPRCRRAEWSSTPTGGAPSCRHRTAICPTDRIPGTLVGARGTPEADERRASLDGRRPSTERCGRRASRARRGASRAPSGRSPSRRDHAAGRTGVKILRRSRSRSLLTERASSGRNASQNVSRTAMSHCAGLPCVYEPRVPTSHRRMASRRLHPAVSSAGRVGPGVVVARKSFFSAPLSAARDRPRQPGTDQVSDWHRR
jgi:hypothetical protein